MISLFFIWEWIQEVFFSKKIKMTTYLVSLSIFSKWIRFLIPRLSILKNFDVSTANKSARNNQNMKISEGLGDEHHFSLKFLMPFGIP